MIRRILAAGALLLLAAGCARYSPTQLQQTAQALGCWPDGEDQPPPTRTPLPSPTATGPPTGPVTPTATPVPTYVPCTPLPLTPTRTPRPTATPTPWTRPTPQPGGAHTTPPLNLSNQPGRDVDPQVAVAPGGAWAAVVWTNLHPDRDDRSTVFVKIQRPGSRGWSPGQGLNTTTVSGNGGMPAVTIDAAGRAWAVWSQHRDGRAEAPSLSWSDDQGQTWSAPAPLPLPGDATGASMYRLAVDASGTVHVLYAVASCFDCSHFVHVAGHPDRGWRLDDQLAPGTKQLYGALTTMTLPSGTIRTVAAVGCYAGCPAGPLVVTQDGDGPWTGRLIPNVDARLAEQVVVGLSLVTFSRDGQAAVCVAWGQYSRSGVFSSCSWDAGTTWQPTEIIAYHDPPRPLEPAPGATPVPPDSDQADRAFAPTLLYDAASNQLMAVWLLRQERDGSGATPMYLVWSARAVRPTGTWQPVIDGATQEPALRLFAPTRRAQARTPSAAYSGQGEALAVWSEREQDESMDVYVGRFTPTGMLIGGQ